jgi:hypothetical protein
MPSLDREALAEFVRHHRVHYDVVPEAVVGPKGRTTVGFELRLFAVHEKGAHAVPGCSKCTALVDPLRELARCLMPSEERPTLIAIEPFGRALYDSTTVPGADEVALSVRLTHRGEYHRAVDACEERCLKEMRARLKALGIAER